MADQILTFDDSSSIQCVTVLVFDDSVVEDGESFNLELTTSSLRVIFTSQTATVIVQDSNSKL